MAWSDTPQAGVEPFRVTTSGLRGLAATPLDAIADLTSTSTVVLDAAMRTLPSGVTRRLQLLRMFGPGLTMIPSGLRESRSYLEWTELGAPPVVSASPCAPGVTGQTYHA